MEEIKAPKKERKFLKAMGEVALTLARELVVGIGKKLINKVGNKRQGLVLAFIILASTFAIAQYPTTGNKQRLGYQTSGDGLVYRGRAADTLSIKSSGLNNAYFILDTINNIVYNYIKTKGGWVFSNGDTIIINNNFTQPFDSLFFKTSVSPNNVDTAKMRWDSDLGTVVLGMYDKVPNELGFKSFWLVKNQTGSTITKGSIVYANGTVGASGRITVAKFIANGSIDAKYLLGITAHDLTDGENGYVISFGKIRQVNTDTFAAGAILYPSPTVAGVWTDVEPVAPNLDMPIGFCINSHVNNGTIAIRVASGYKLSELHDVAITSPVDRASLYYKSGLWRDTTAALLVSDTASMLTNYLRTGVAVNTFLPLSGGTLTGALNGTTGTFNTRLGVGSFAASPMLFASGTGNQEVHFAHSQNIAGATVTLRLTNTNADNYTQGAYFQGIVNRGVNEMSGALGTNGSEYIRLRGVDDAGVVGVGIFNTNPSYNLDVSGTFRATGASLIGGTLGITGATTLTNLASASTTIVTASSTGLLSGTTTLPILNGGTGATTNTQARTNLGATVRGANTFLLPDLGAISFLRYNADNTVSALDATTFRTAIGAGTGNGNGTVTNVTGIAPISVATGTTTPAITIANAGVSTTGVVTASTQTFGGAKTFNGVLNASSELNVTGFSTLTGGASVGTLATTSSLTRVLGINSSNTIGELSLGTGMSVGSGVLSVQAAGASATGLVTSFAQTFGGNKTFNGTVTLASATGTATSVIGRSSTGQIVGVTLGTGLSLTSGTLSATAGNDINIYLAINGPGITLASSFGVYSHWYVNINQSSTVSVTLPSASGNINKTLYIKNSGTGAVNSNATNVEPLNSTTLGTAILTSGGGKYATLVSNGTNWIKMSGN